MIFNHYKTEELDATKENTNDILCSPAELQLCQDEERTDKNPLQGNQEILLRSARKPKYHSAERVKVPLALIIEEAAVQRDCTQTSECTVAKTEALNWKQGDMTAGRATHGNQWQI